MVRTNWPSTFQGNSGYFAQLIKDELKYLGSIDLLQYFVKYYDMHDEDVHLQHDNKGIQVDFVFGRRFLNHGLTEFLPPIIICVVSLFTCFFKVGKLQGGKLGYTKLQQFSVTVM